MNPLENCRAGRVSAGFFAWTTGLGSEKSGKLTTLSTGFSGAGPVLRIQLLMVKQLPVATDTDVIKSILTQRVPVRNRRPSGVALHRGTHLCARRSG